MNTLALKGRIHMSELKMTFNQIKNEAIREFENGFDSPEDMNDCTNTANQDFHCCGNDCPNCSGNNECRPTCISSSADSSSQCSITDCPNENVESCTIERIWEMTEHIPPQTITDETGTNNHYIKTIRITKTYRNIN